MNKILTIFSLLFLVSGSLYCQEAEEEKKLDLIRQWYTAINANTDQFEKVELADVSVYQDINPYAYSMEGTEIYRLATADMTKFFDGDESVKIVVTFEGDREDLVSAYYFREGRLFFVDKLKTIYHKPKWHEEFDKSDRSVLKNRFYFNNNSLMRWVDSDIQPVGEMDPLFKKHESTILNDMNSYQTIEIRNPREVFDYENDN